MMWRFLIRHHKIALCGALLLVLLGYVGYAVWNHNTGGALPVSAQIWYGWLESPDRLRLYVKTCADSPRVLVRETPDLVRLSASTYPIPCYGIGARPDAEVEVQLQSPLGNRRVVDEHTQRVVELRDRYRIEEVPPCTPVPNSHVDPCDPNAPAIDFSLRYPKTSDASAPTTVRVMLDGDPLTSVTHLVLRGTYLPGTVRCTSGELFRPLSILERKELPTTTPIRAFNCYVDIRANAYLIGSGPHTISALLAKWQYTDTRDDEKEIGKAEQDIVEQHRLLWERRVSLAFSGREHVIFLGTSIDLSSAVWRIVDYWDVQRLEDGTVVAVHRSSRLIAKERPDEYQFHRPALVMGMSAFRQAVATANQARVAEYGGRIGADASLPALVTDAYRPWDFYGEAGAYPAGGNTTNSTPPTPYPKAKRGQSFPHLLFTLCGVQDTYFDGRLWMADPPIEYDENGYPLHGWGFPVTTGTIGLVQANRAVFTTTRPSPQILTFIPWPSNIELKDVSCISGPHGR